MSERKSMMLYLDSVEQWEILTDEQAGILIKALLRYNKTGEQLETSDGMLKMAFSFLTAQSNRDNAKYEAKCERNRRIALEREERKRAERDKENTNVYERVRTCTKSTYTDTDTDTDTVTDTVTDTDTVIAIEKGMDTVSIPYGYPMDTVSKEQKKEKKPAALDVIISDYTENEELREALKAFVKFRKALSKGVLTERALNLNLNKLDTLADTDERKLAIVNQALERGWKSFYPLKEEPKEDNKPGMSKYDFVINNF